MDFTTLTTDILRGLSLAGFVFCSLELGNIFKRWAVDKFNGFSGSQIISIIVSVIGPFQYSKTEL